MDFSNIAPNQPKAFEVSFILRSANLEDPPSVFCSKQASNHKHKTGGILDRLSCCSFQGGFLIRIDGKPWNDVYAIDEFWMTFTWVAALKSLVRANDQKSTASAFPWEGSRLFLSR
jgi:hypothetical protein